MFIEDVKAEYVTTSYGTRYLRLGRSEWYAIRQNPDESVGLQYVVRPKFLEIDYNKMVCSEGEKNA